MQIARLAKFYERSTLEIIRTVDLSETKAVALLGLGIYSLSAGNSQSACNRLEESMRIEERQGATRVWEEAASYLLLARILFGDWQAADKLFEELRRISTRLRDFQTQCIGYYLKAGIDFYRGNFEAAVGWLRSAERALGDPREFTCDVAICGLTIMISLRTGDFQTARTEADRLRSMLPWARPTSYNLSFGFFAMVEYSLHALTKDFSRENLSLARKAFSQLRIFVFHQAIGRSRGKLYEGMFRSLTGETRQACEFFDQTIKQAIEHHLPYEEGLGCFLLAKTGQGQLEPEKIDRLLQSSKEIFQRLGASWDLDQVSNWSAMLSPSSKAAP